MTERQNLLAEQLALVTTERDTARQQLVYAQSLLRCSRFSPDHPLVQHKHATICAECYEVLRAQYVLAAIVSSSIAATIRARMKIGQPCPFCNQGRRHAEYCYLHAEAGERILSEYTAIEQHRDMLLAEKARTNGTVEMHKGTVRMRLKKRHRHPPAAQQVPAPIPSVLPAAASVGAAGTT